MVPPGPGQVLPEKAALGTASLPLTLEHATLWVGTHAVLWIPAPGGTRRKERPAEDRIEALLSLSPLPVVISPSQPSNTG